jgi:hypothetical protein
MNAEGKGNRFGRDALSHMFENVEIERLTDVVASQIFDRRVHNQLIIACLPRSLRREAPFHFLPSDAHRPAQLSAGGPFSEWRP